MSNLLMGSVLAFLLESVAGWAHRREQPLSTVNEAPFDYLGLSAEPVDSVGVPLPDPRVPPAPSAPPDMLTWVKSFDAGDLPNDAWLATKHVPKRYLPLQWEALAVPLVKLAGWVASRNALHPGPAPFIVLPVLSGNNASIEVWHLRANAWVRVIRVGLLSDHRYSVSYRILRWEKQQVTDKDRVSELLADITFQYDDAHAA